MSEDRKKRAQEMKDGPNSIVEELVAPKDIQKEMRSEKKDLDSPEKKDQEPRDLQDMSLKHFLALDFGPKKIDQAAGFAHHARKEKARTLPEWREAFAEFMAKPIK